MRVFLLLAQLWEMLALQAHPGIGQWLQGAGIAAGASFVFRQGEVTWGMIRCDLGPVLHMCSSIR